MSSEKEKVTALKTSAATDDGQSHNQILDSIIAEMKEKHKAELEKMSKVNDTGKTLKTLSELYDTHYPPRTQIVENLLCSGTYILAGSPKIGKSFLVAQLAYHVSLGLPLWEHNVHRSKTIYFALEDTEQDHQQRLSRMFGSNDADDYLVETEAETLQEGFDCRLLELIKSYPDVRLIIIDPLEKVRGIETKTYNYANDYKTITRLKHFSDTYDICIVVVHHTRKQDADDCFDKISGTTGLLGAADGALILGKEKRTSNNAILDIVGRYQQDQRLHLLFDRERLKWEFVKKDCELWIEPPNPLLEQIAQLLSHNAKWKGNATELKAALGTNMNPNVLSRQLNVNIGRLWNEYKISLEGSRTSNNKSIHLTLHRANDGNDDNDDNVG